jgi:hypothetical protein
MPYASRANSLRGTGAVSRKRTTRRRAPATLKIKYQAPTARHQRSQILSNARTLAKHSRLLRQHKVFTDYQYAGDVSPAISDTWAVDKLTDFANWTAVLRQDDNVLESSHTFVIRGQLNIRAFLGDADFCYFNVFIVTKRRNANEFDPFTTPPALGSDYIENPFNQGANLRLNSAIYKVHWCAYASLTNNGLGRPVNDASTAGDPRTTYKKWQVNLPFKMSVTQPAHVGIPAKTTWKDLHFPNLPPHHQYYIMCNMSWGGPGIDEPSLNFDQLATCINTS